jgi:hypothetical protein
MDETRKFKSLKNRGRVVVAALKFIVEILGLCRVESSSTIAQL